MKKLLWVLVAAPLAVYGFEYSYSGGNLSPAGMSDKSGHDHQAMVAAAGATAQDPQAPQDPNDSDDPNYVPPTPPAQGDQPGDTPSHRYSPGSGCSAVDPKAPSGKDLNGVEPNTVGCTCKRTCVNGNTGEDLTRDEKGVYVCKNACNKDRCFCPDPCKN